MADPQTPPSNEPARPAPRAMVALWLALAIGFAGTVYAVHQWAESRALAAQAERGQAALQLHVEVLRGWLSRHMALAPVHADNPNVLRLLRHPEDGVQRDLVNLQLERWTSATGAAVTYLLDTEGTTLASSNWNEPGSFVGRNYAFRPYFQQALGGALGRYFALGTVTGLRGYFFAAPVRDGGPALGTVVVKVPVEPIENELRVSPFEVFATDDAGVIVLAGNPAWRMRTLGPVSAEDRAQIARERRFDSATLAEAEIETLEQGSSPAPLVRAVADRSEARPAEFLHLSTRMELEDWDLHLLMPTAPARTEAWTRAGLAAAILALLGLGAFYVAQRRRELIRRLEARERAKAALERAVAERTADLSATNTRLSREVAERTQAEAALRQTQTELIQAGKLAALGQMSTALSHEYNQPLAAIRSYAENAIAFLERGRPGQATENLGRIARLTERMAELSKHLTSFARKPKDTVAPVALAPVIAQALELMRGRIERRGVALSVSGAEGIAVMGGQTRLQHVLMNLVGNALDATAFTTAPEITIRIQTEGDRVVLTVEDNGTGIAPEAAETLFDPFVTTKPEGQGLGLGLSITYNILSDFGGGIRAETRPEGGARMTVTLRRAEMPALTEPTA